MIGDCTTTVLRWLINFIIKSMCLLPRLRNCDFIGHSDFSFDFFFLKLLPLGDVCIYHNDHLSIEKFFSMSRMYARVTQQQIIMKLTNGNLHLSEWVSVLSFLCKRKGLVFAQLVTLTDLKSVKKGANYSREQIIPNEI